MTWDILKGLKLLDIRHDDNLYIQTDKGWFKSTAEGD